MISPGYQRMFFEAQMPQLISAIKKLTEAIEKASEPVVELKEVKKTNKDPYDHLQSLADAAQAVVNSRGGTTDIKLENLEDELVRAYDFLDDVFDDINHN